MAIPFVPGPAQIFVGTPAAPLFLGYSKSGVSFSKEYGWVPYHCDLGGAIPMDWSYQGTGAVISFTLVRWDPVVLAGLEDVVNKLGSGSSPGVDVPGEIGTLMGYEDQAWSLWVVFPYQRSLPYATHPAGYRFPYVIPEREGLPEQGSKPSEVSLSLRAIRRLFIGPQYTNTFGSGAFVLYDNDVTAVNNIIPN